MDLNDILAEVEGVGDAFVASPVALPEQVTAARPTVNAQAPQHVAHLPQDYHTAPTAEPDPSKAAMAMVLDVELEMVVELGNVTLTVQELMTMASGHELTLDRLPTEPCRIFVNDELVAYGEPLVVDGELAVKVTELVTPRSDLEKT